MNVTLSHPTKKLKGTVVLPASKSISNRVLMLKHVLGLTTELQNVSEADDTVLMQMALAKGNGTIHLKNAGTCMRFLTAYFAATENSDSTLLCDERMEKRPIHELVNVLQQLGAEITYLHKPGFPPLHIKGKQLNGGHVQVSASASSQFVSALMMIAPLCKNDLTIELTGDITSAPYIEMTVKLMQAFGINILEENSTFDIRHSKNALAASAEHYTIESDWSAASYWYIMVALSLDAELFLPHLSTDSMQGDSKIAFYMHYFGVETIQQSTGILLRKNKAPNTIPPDINLVNEPDLAPSLAVVAAATHTPLVLSGLQNLAIKESNRLTALETELSKLGFGTIASEDTLTINPHPPQIVNPIPTAIGVQISTYNDHRMAMAFAPLSLIFNSLSIENAEVVHKSYPHFWDDLEQVGFVVSHTL